MIFYQRKEHRYSLLLVVEFFFMFVKFGKDEKT